MTPATTTSGVMTRRDMPSSWHVLETGRKRADGTAGLRGRPGDDAALRGDQLEGGHRPAGRGAASARWPSSRCPVSPISAVPVYRYGRNRAATDTTVLAPQSHRGATPLGRRAGLEEAAPAVRDNRERSWRRGRADGGRDTGDRPCGRGSA